MDNIITKSKNKIISYLTNYYFTDNKQGDLFDKQKDNLGEKKKISLGDDKYFKIVNEFWTSKQRKGNSLHEVSYRACFKPQLPNFFINHFSWKNDLVYDPFAGRGTTLLEAALLGRNIISNDINPLSKIFLQARIDPPNLSQVKKRLSKIKMDSDKKADIDLSMFYHPKTEAQLVNLKKYLTSQKEPDHIDNWIRMVATNRLTGHSKGFFSVYTLPPNQAASQKSQKKINKKREQEPPKKDIKSLIIKKSKSLLRDLTLKEKKVLKKVSKKAKILAKDARKTEGIEPNSVQLTVTSPPFLDIVDYEKDNWLRLWFNGYDSEKIGKKITTSKKVSDWEKVMAKVLAELYRITKKNGYLAFEVGEVKKGKIRLDEHILPLGVKAGFEAIGIVINEQDFTKTSNIWGVKNNKGGTNTNRIVVFRKK